MNEERSKPGIEALRISRNETPIRPARRRGRHRLRWVGIAALVILVVIIVLSVRGAAPKVESASVDILIPASANAPLTATGYVVAQRKAAVASKGTGRLEALLVREGDRVTAGQVIARLEADDVNASLAAARAAVKQAEAGLARSRALAQEQAVAFERAQKLRADQLISQADFDHAQAQNATAIAQVDADQAALASARADANLAEVQVENTYIRAPFDGTVLTKDADVGEVVAPFASSPTSRGDVVTLADMRSLEVEADVSESNIRQVQLDQPCLIALDALPTEPYRGRVAKIVPTADRAKATVQTKIAFDNLDDRVLPEMSAKVSFLPEGADTSAAAIRAVLTVPSNAVVKRGGRMVVFAIRDNRAVEVPVETGTLYGTAREIRGAITSGEIVVVAPPERLRDGQRVKI